LVSITKSFCTRYASHLLYASEANYSKPNVEEPEPEPKDVKDSESEPELKEPEPEVKEPEVEELPIETLIYLLTEPTMRSLSLSPTMIFSLSLRSPDVYDTLQIFLQEAKLQEIKQVMMQSAVSSVFIMNDSHLSATCDRIDLPSFTFSLSRKPVPPPPPPCASHDAVVLLSRSVP